MAQRKPRAPKPNMRPKPPHAKKPRAGMRPPRNRAQKVGRRKPSRMGFGNKRTMPMPEQGMKRRKRVGT
jgi:hypothetical protein